MNHRIPQTFIDELLARVDIIELIDSRITLKKSGANYTACCPFHTEKTPSFSVSATKQFYYCFGCAAHGNALGFLMAYDRMEFVEAVEHLAHKAGVEIPQETGQTTSFDLSLYDLMQNAADFYHQQLKNNSEALAYVQQRGISAEIIDLFKLGFAPSAWDSLQTHLAKNAQIQQQLLTTGMSIKNAQGKIYDRFRNRLIFPLIDTRGHTIAFGGRTLTNEQPKYLNSPETVIFHKGSELYGLYEARHAQQQLEKVIVVEGYMDVIALVQHGITYAVATMGTATSAKHIQRLVRYTQEIIFCFDGDRAGQQAAWRALEISLSLIQDGLQIRFMFLPEAEDPDSLIRKEGIDAFQQRIAQAVSLSDYFYRQLSSQVNLSTLDGKAKLAKLALDKLNKLPPGVFHQLMTERLNLLVGTNVDQFAQVKPTEIAETNETTDISNFSTLLPPVHLALALLLQNPSLAQEISLSAALIELPLAGVPTLVKLHQQLNAQPTLTTGGILELWRNTKQAPNLAKLAAWQLLTPSAGVKAELENALQKIQKLGHEKTVQQLLSKANKATLTPNEQQQLLQLLADRQLAAE